MTRRILDSDIWTNENFAALPPMARLLQIGIINLADDQGRMKAHPAYLRSQIFPYDDCTTEQLEGWLHLMEQNETLLVYQVVDKLYVQLVNWWTYQQLQWAHPSRYPAPDGWQDRVRISGAGRDILTYNWTTPAGANTPDTCDAQGKIPSSQPPDAPPSQPPSQPRRPLTTTKLNLTTTTTTDASGDSCGGGGLCDLSDVLSAWAEYEMQPKATARTTKQLTSCIEQHGAPAVLKIGRAHV